MKSASFKKGFARGFSAPFFFFTPLEIRRPSQFNGSVAKAWADVGRALADATKEQGAIIEQEAGNRKSIRRKPRTQAA